MFTNAEIRELEHKIHEEFKLAKKEDNVRLAYEHIDEIIKLRNKIEIIRECAERPKIEWYKSDSTKYKHLKIKNSAV